MDKVAPEAPLGQFRAMAKGVVPAVAPVLPSAEVLMAGSVTFTGLVVTEHDGLTVMVTELASEKATICAVEIPPLVPNAWYCQYPSTPAGTVLLPKGPVTIRLTCVLTLNW